MLKRAAQQRIATWLAFAAMALLVLMPSISRSMQSQMDMGGMSGMSADCLMAMDTGHRHATPGIPDDPTARCAYCVLLSHSPATGLSSVVLWLPAEIVAIAPPIALIQRVAPAPLLSAHPRGPPSLIDG